MKIALCDDDEKELSNKMCIRDRSKMCNDLRILASGPKAGFGEITLPAMQNGSSIDVYKRQSIRCL